MSRSVVFETIQPPWNWSRTVATSDTPPKVILPESVWSHIKKGALALGDHSVQSDTFQPRRGDRQLARSLRALARRAGVGDEPFRTFVNQLADLAEMDLGVKFRYESAARQQEEVSPPLPQPAADDGAFVFRR